MTIHKTCVNCNDKALFEHHFITFDNNLFYGTPSGKSLECLQRHFITHTHTHTHTHTTNTCITSHRLVEWEGKKMTDQYAEEKRWFFSFDWKEESEESSWHSDRDRERERKKAPDQWKEWKDRSLPQCPPTHPRNMKHFWTKCWLIKDYTRVHQWAGTQVRLQYRSMAL